MDLTSCAVVMPEYLVLLRSLERSKLSPVISVGKPIYSEYHNMSHSLVKKVVKLQTNYRFDNDLEFGELLDRYRKNEWTKEDIKTIN